MTQKLMPLSFSRLSCFEQCPAKFDYLYVTKSAKDEDSVHTLYGTRVHTALELYGRALGGDVTAEAELAMGGDDAEWAKHKGLVDRIVARKGKKLYEHQMALDGNKNPCDWFSPDVWLRGIADVLIVDGDTAWVLDWKTGKVKENPTQLQLFALLTMIHFPAVKTVKTSFIWLNYNTTTDTSFTRAMIPHLWVAIEPRLAAVQEAVDLGVFTPKPTGLCGWCPAKQMCPSARRR